MDAPRTILIVEDEPLIAMMLEDFIESLGHRICGVCDDLPSAMDQAQNGDFDLAILDANLKGEMVWPVARQLAERGTPYLLASGGFVEEVPSEFAAAALLEKPYTIDRVSAAIGELLAGRPENVG